MGGILVGLSLEYSHRLRVMALFPDGITRDVTPAASSFKYSSYDDEVIRIDEDNSTVQALQAGSTTLTVEFSGLTVEVPVSVYADK